MRRVTVAPAFWAPSDGCVRIRAAERGRIDEARPQVDLRRRCSRPPRGREPETKKAARRRRTRGSVLTAAAVPTTRNDGAEPLAPQDSGGDAHCGDRDEQEGDEQKPAGTGRRDRRGEGLGCVDWPRGRLGAGLSGLVRAGLSGLGASDGTCAVPRVLGDVEQHGRIGAGRPLDVVSHGGWECRRVRGRRRPRRPAQAPSRRVRPRRTGRSPRQTEPSAAGPFAVAGDATTTAKPTAKVTVRSIRIDIDMDASTITSRGRGSRGPAEASRISLRSSAHASGRRRVLRARLRERELQHDDLGGGGGARVVDAGTRRGRRSPRTSTVACGAGDGNAVGAPRRMGACLDAVGGQRGRRVPAGRRSGALHRGFLPRGVHDHACDPDARPRRDRTCDRGDRTCRALRPAVQGFRARQQPRDARYPPSSTA